MENQELVTGLAVASASAALTIKPAPRGLAAYAAKATAELQNSVLPTERYAADALAYSNDDRLFHARQLKKYGAVEYGVAFKGYDFQYALLALAWLFDETVVLPRETTVEVMMENIGVPEWKAVQTDKANMAANLNWKQVARRATQELVRFMQADDTLFMAAPVRHLLSTIDYRLEKSMQKKAPKADAKVQIVPRAALTAISQEINARIEARAALAAASESAQLPDNGAADGTESAA